MSTKRRNEFAQNIFRRSRKMEKKFEEETQEKETCNEEPQVVEEIQVEELAIDGICGVY